MQSLTISLANPSSLPGPGVSEVPGSEPATPESAFAALLGAKVATKDAPAGEIAIDPALPTGTVLPETAATGKNLPPSPETTAEEGETPTEGTLADDAALAQAAFALLAQVAPAAPAAEPANEAAAPSPALRAPLAAIATPATPVAGDKADAPAAKPIEITVARPAALAPQSPVAAPGERPESDSEPGFAATRTRAPVAEPSLVRTAAVETFALATNMPAGSDTAPSAPHLALRVVSASAAVDRMQALTQIVETLAAAREALAPAAAALAIDHAEFGELSLRIDQQRDGRLAVQIEAASPEAHRAVAAAVGTHSANLSADTPSSGSSQAQATARDAGSGHFAANRESGSGEAAAGRKDTSTARRAPAREDQATPDQPRQAGVYA